jgi:hypothetical protein
MTANPNPPSGGYVPPATSPSSTNPSGAAQAGPGSGVYPAAQPGTGYPWDELITALKALTDAETGANARVEAARTAYAAIEKAPVGDPLVTPGAVTAEAKTNALNAYVQAGNDLVGLKNRQAQTAADIATAKQAYNEQQDKNALTPQTQARLQADTDAARKQADMYGAQAEQAAAQTKLLTSPEGKEKQAAETRLTNANAAVAETQKGYVESQTTLNAANEAEQRATAALTGARATAYPAESAAGITLQGAQANAAQATADATAQATREHQQGALGTFIDQTTAQAAAGLITKQEAEAQIEAFAQAQKTGATPYEWQQQADANARQVATSMIQSGQMVGLGQQFVAGGEPGGILEQAAAQWGFKAPSVQLHPTGAPAYMQSLGMTTGSPQPQAQGGAPAQGGPPAYLQSLPGDIPDYSHLSLAQIEAMHTAPAQQPAAASPSNVQVGATSPAGAMMGGVGGGLALGPIITGAPNYARLPGT